jgi:quercetin dioxygenase-like cupin family protein
MSAAGDIFENPATGEHGYIRIGTDETDGQYMMVDLRVNPGGAVLGEHVHKTLDERFTVLHGMISYKLAGREGSAGAGEVLDLPKGIAHDWWNGGEDEARVIVEIKPAARFEQMVGTLFGLARDGKTNSKGMPNMLQLALISQEFEDTVQFTNPPVAIQKALFAILAPIGRFLGYQAIYPQYLEFPAEKVEVEPLPEGVVIAGL